MKTDRRDALHLAEQSRAGALTAVWVLDESDEAIRDLSRAYAHYVDEDNWHARTTKIEKLP